MHSLADDIAARAHDCHVAFSLLQPAEAAVLTSLLWSLVLLGMGLVGQWRQHAHGSTDETEGEVDTDDGPEAGEEKRLAFACLSSAIEEVQGKVTEQQYLALYSAAVWCFNLTPYWAGTLPSPPPPPEAATPAVQLRLRVTPDARVRARLSALPCACGTASQSDNVEE